MFVLGFLPKPANAKGRYIDLRCLAKNHVTHYFSSSRCQGQPQHAVTRRYNKVFQGGCPVYYG